MNSECAALAEETDSQEARSHGDARRGRSIGRRAKHADSRDVRERKYKPHRLTISGLYLRSLTSRQAAFGGQSNGPQLFAIFVVVTFFVV